MGGSVVPAAIRPAWACSVAAGLLAAALGLSAAPTAAGEAASDEPRARAAYDRGSRAYKRGDYAAAAAAFAEADALQPNPVALATALEATLLADDPALGAELCDRAAGRPGTTALDDLVRRARARFAGRAGRVRVSCPGAEVCTATLDGRPITPGRAVLTLTGEHVITVTSGGRAEERRADVAPDALVEVSASPAPAAPAAPVAPIASAPPRDDRPSLAWFFAGLGVTAAASAGTIASAVDAQHRHDRFVQASCPGPVHGDCSGLAGAGLGAERRTNVLIGVTAALGAATAVVGVFVFRARSVSVSVGALGGGPVALLRAPL